MITQLFKHKEQKKLHNKNGSIKLTWFKILNILYIYIKLELMHNFYKYRTVL